MPSYYSSSSSGKQPTSSSSYRSSNRYAGESASSRYPGEAKSSRYGESSSSIRYPRESASTSTRDRDPYTSSSSSRRHDPYMGSSGYQDPSTSRSSYSRRDSLAALSDIKDRSRDPYGRQERAHYPESRALTPPGERASARRGSSYRRDESEGLSRYSLDFYNSLDPYADKVKAKGEGERYLRY